jgi:hypothetical protein
MTAPAVPLALPFGMRDCKIYPYLDAQGTILAPEGFDLPVAQTFSFADNETFVDLRGDDELVATHGNGAQVNWTLEAGGISLQVWSVFTGGQIIESGVAPNRVITLRKCSDDLRPYFRVDGQIMSDSGGDVVATVYRGKCNGDIKGQFADGAFFITSADGIGLAIPGTRLLYDIAQHESKSFLSTTPVKIPTMPPKNAGLSALTDVSATLIWEPVTAVTGYACRYSNDAGETWVDAVVADGETSCDLTPLTPETAYLAQLASKVGTELSAWGSSISFATLPTENGGQADAPLARRRA